MSTQTPCYGIGCNQHTLCALYHAVETTPSETRRQGSCSSGRDFTPLGAATPADVPDDVLRQILFGHG